MAQKRTRTTASRRSSYSTRKSSGSLKTYKIFSPITLVIVVVLVVVAALVGAYQNGGDNASQALSLTTIGATQRGLAGYTTVGNGTTLGSAPVGKLTLVGSNLGAVRTLQIGNTSVPASATTNSNGTQTVTVNIPPGALTCTQATTTCNPNAASQLLPKCSGGSTACNVPPISTSGEVDALPKDAAGNTIGNVTSISTSAIPTINSVVVSGSSAQITGTGLLPGSTVTIGRAKVTATVLSNNADGTTTIGASVNTSSCLFSNLPLLNRLCHNASTGNNNVSVTSDGQASNTLGVNLVSRSNTSSAATAGALGNTGLGGSGGTIGGGGSSGSSGGFCTPSACYNNKGQASQSCAGSAFNGSEGKYLNAPQNGTVKVIKPAAGDVWNYGSAFTFSWVNPGTQITPSTNGVIQNATAFAQVTLLGGCMHYNVQNYLDLDSEGAAAARAHDPDNDLMTGVNAWQENENHATGCGTDPGGSSNCDTDDPGDPGNSFAAWAAETDTADQDGASSGMLCFAVLAGDSPTEGKARYEDPNVGTPGATITVSVPSCVFGRPPSGTYTAWVQVFGVSGPAVCAPGHRCSGLPTKIGQAADGVSDPFQIN